MAAADAGGPRSILFATDTTPAGKSLLGNSDRAATAEIVVAGDGSIVKDRHGDAAAVLTRLRAALVRSEFSGEVTDLTLLGVPLSEVDALTIDGTHWMEVFGRLTMFAPFGGPVLRFRVGQSPGGKKAKAKFGVAQGDVIYVREDAVCGVQRRGGGGESLTDQPLAVQPLCKCGHRYDHHSQESFSTRCKHDQCDCAEYRPEAGP